jgi:hypothetical protein
MYFQVPHGGGLGLYGLGQSTGRFEGTFVGNVTGDMHTKTGAKVTLTHRDTTIAGTFVLFPGLMILMGPPCGIVRLDLGTVTLSATWDPAKPNHFEAVAQADNKLLTFVADLQADPQTLVLKLTIDPLVQAPDNCGTRTLTMVLRR